ncbi:MAG: helix-turn-helix domain-containing protein [Bdellovibrionales bacterium]
MNRLKIIRKQAGFTQEEVAKNFKVTPQTILRLEKGERGVTLDWLEKLAKFYKVRVSALVDDIDVSDVKQPDADVDEVLLREILTYAQMRCKGAAVDPATLAKVVCKTYRKCRKIGETPKKAEIKERVDDMLTCVVD